MVTQMTAKNQSTVSTRLIPIQKWNDFHVWPPYGGMQHIRFNKEKNGFSRAFKKIGGRVLIDEAAFFECANKSEG